MSQYQRPNIQRMQGYRWGEQPEDDQCIKLNTNENPYPPSPAVAQALLALPAPVYAPTATHSGQATRADR